jgi:tRNA (cytidine/uridine-2'-O-)-methyltransferase
MFNIVLVEPDIPQNTGNIIRLCANTGCHLHLIRPLGFVLDDKRLRRAGLDYHEFASVRTYKNMADFLDNNTSRLFAIETCGTKRYDEISYQPGDTLLFGAETKGLSQKVLKTIPPDNQLSIPMQKNVRSLNLSNSVALVVYEAWRQQDFMLTFP